MKSDTEIASLQSRYMDEDDSVYDEVAELENEEDRYLFLHFAIKNHLNNSWYHNEAKETVRKSREHYGHPVPNPEFFNY